MRRSSLLPEYHTFRFTPSGIDAAFPEELFRNVINTDAFRRLRSIHFLGSIDYLLNQNSRVESKHTRFDHSLSVATLAKRFCLWKGVPGAEFDQAIVAALLHDIGHAPLSHSLEPAFRSIFEIDHHQVGERILRGEVRPGVRLAQVLKAHEINNFEVMALIAGVGQGVASNIFSRSINADTIEGIIRSATYLVRQEVLPNPVEVLDAFANLSPASRTILDEFWNLKGVVYNKVIQSRKGLMADFLCKRYMELNSGSFKASYYYGTEKELRTDHRRLFDALDDLGKYNRVSPSIIRDGEVIQYARRSFHIDTSVPLRTYADVDRRYLQSKESVRIEVRKLGGDDAHGVLSNPEVQKLL